jgi:glycosyltransferase involved in cell wall biosynthesis
MTSSTPLVSILVPSYNAARYLPELCRSIQAQSYPHYEVIIGNDGSSDNTVAVLAPFLQDHRFQLLTWPQNRGAHQAWTILCGAARGEYWCAPGADDALYPSFLQSRVARMAANPQACLVHGAAELINESGAPVQHTHTPPHLPPQLRPPRSLEVLLQHNVINTPSVMVRTSVTRQVLPYLSWNWGYTNDWFTWILHASTVFDLLWDPEVHSKYRVHSSSLSLAPEKDDLRRAEVRLVPLVALRTAAQYSQWAALSWSRRGRALYRQWLRRAAELNRRGALKDEWLQLAAHAYYGARGRRVSLWVELARHSVGLVLAYARHRQATQRQSFVVAGLAEINDPIFCQQRNAHSS